MHAHSWVGVWTALLCMAPGFLSTNCQVLQPARLYVYDIQWISFNLIDLAINFGLQGWGWGGLNCTSSIGKVTGTSSFLTPSNHASGLPTARVRSLRGCNNVLHLGNNSHTHTTVAVASKGIIGAHTHQHVPNFLETTRPSVTFWATIKPQLNIQAAHPTSRPHCPFTWLPAWRSAGDR